MKPLAVDTMVLVNGIYYWVDAILEGGENPLYRLRRTCMKGLAKRMEVAHHTDVKVCGGVLI